MNSFNSFKSFDEIYLDNFLRNHLRNEFRLYYAHLHERKNPETLVEHTERVCQFALQLIRVHHLESVVNQLIVKILEQENSRLPDEVGSFIKEQFFNAIVFHDVGKINENFQRKRMKNNRFQPNRANNIGSRHSILSAFIFISTYLDKIYHFKESSEEKKFLLYVLCFLFSIPILRHHSPYLEEEFCFPDELLEALQPYLKRIHIDVDQTRLKIYFNNFEERLKWFTNDFCSEPCYFSLFALIKLCYSLLTAADYCATSRFSMDLEISDFGVLSKQDKQLLVENFQKIKFYNRNFFEKRDYIRNLSFNLLNRCNSQNLNLLRQKLLDEVLSSIESNQDQNVYYLEAPTGSGKTNISIAAALQLLKQNEELNKIYYVFPFTTLITQTANSIHETLNLPPEFMVQLHSRSGFTPKRDGDIFASEHLNYIDYLFVNYPITLLTHVKFFEILKTNSKEPNYIFHRLANSVVIIDELQSYPPREWDKIVFFIKQAADLLNIKFILMSATLPKLDQLDVFHFPFQFFPLVKNKNLYFQNPNFKDRVRFNFDLLNEKLNLEKLGEFVVEHCEEYSKKHNGNVKGIIEFIYKKTASGFYKQIELEAAEKGYQLFLLSGTILEPRRKEVIQLIKKSESKTNKIILITTQVVEAGVDIDMDIGFKDKSLIDSDEQLAGRVNRNARQEASQVFIFNLDPAYYIYGTDLRYRISQDFITYEDYKKILSEKDFDFLYEKVCQRINQENKNEYMMNFSDYKKFIKKLDFKKIDWEFKIIDQKNVTIFVPMQIPQHYFSNDEKNLLRQLDCYQNDKLIDGEKLWKKYLEITQTNNLDFIKKKIEIKRIYTVMSQFMFSIYAHSNLLAELLRFCDPSYYDKYGILYLYDWRKVYDFEIGIKDEEFNEPAFI